MTLGQLRTLHADEDTGGFDYCICSDVRGDKDICIVDIDAKTPLNECKTVLALTSLNKDAEAGKCKLTVSNLDKLGLAAKVVKPVPLEPIEVKPIIGVK
jgi:hypothetical protein